MLYEYRCEQCDYSFDVVKSHTEYNREEFCVTCKNQAVRQISSNIYFSGTKVEHAEYNPAFGKVIKNKRHRQYEAEKRGLIEVGSDFKSGESMQKHFDTRREEKLNRDYEE